jgi:hypothetical protein
VSSGPALLDYARGVRFSFARIALIATPLLSAAVATGAVACGIRSPLTDDLIFERVDAGSDSATADASSRDAAPADAGPGDAPVDALPDVALPPTDLGNVLLQSGDYGNGDADVFVASAAFFADVRATGCDIRALDQSCTLETCAAGATPAAYSAAGAISVGGGTMPLSMQQGPAGDYNAAGSTIFWQGGETLTVAAGGADVPAFTSQIVAPTQVIYTAPLPSVVDLTAPFALAWTGKSAGKLAFDLSATSTPTKLYLECTFDVAAQRATVPVSALSTLPPGATGALTISTLVESDIHAGPWLVKTFAQSFAGDALGHECSISAILQ